MKSKLAGALGAGALTLGICRLFVLPLWSFGLIWLTGTLLFPWVFRWLESGRREKEIYYEMATYMEQLLCSYRRTGSISLSIEDCSSLFPEDGAMGQALRQAQHVLQTGEGVEGGRLVRGALSCVDDRYDSRRLRLLHDFLEQAENSGGEAAEALDILLRDLQMWKKRTTVYQKKRQFIRREYGAAVVLSGALCGLSRLLFPPPVDGMLVRSLVYQIATTVFVLLLFMAEAVMLRKMTGSWLDAGEKKDGREMRRMKREYALLQRKKTGLRKNLARQACRQEVEREFPYWLLSVTVYLQQEGLLQAVNRSLEQLQGIFRTEVKRLRRRICEDPSGLFPFTEFFGSLELPEVQTGMKLLYSVNYNGCEEAGRQIRFLVEQNNRIMDQSESRRFENQAAGFGVLRQIPMTFACVKVIVDMLLFLALAMGNNLAVL